MISNYEFHGDEMFCRVCQDEPKCMCEYYQEQREEEDYQNSRDEK